MQTHSLFRRALAEVPGILRLALPIVMGLAASTLIGVTDTLMLAPLGPVPLAAEAAWRRTAWGPRLPASGAQAARARAPQRS